MVESYFYQSYEFAELVVGIFKGISFLNTILGPKET